MDIISPCKGTTLERREASCPPLHPSVLTWVREESGRSCEPIWGGAGERAEVGHSSSAFSPSESRSARRDCLVSMEVPVTHRHCLPSLVKATQVTPEQVTFLRVCSGPAAGEASARSDGVSGFWQTSSWAGSGITGPRLALLSAHSSGASGCHPCGPWWPCWL